MPSVDLLGFTALIPLASRACSRSDGLLDAIELRFRGKAPLRDPAITMVRHGAAQGRPLDPYRHLPGGRSTLERRGSVMTLARAFNSSNKSRRRETRAACCPASWAFEPLVKARSYFHLTRWVTPPECPGAQRVGRPTSLSRWS